MHQRRRSGLPDVIAAPMRRMKVLTARLTRGLSVLRRCAGPTGPGDGKRGRLTGTCRGDPPAHPQRPRLSDRTFPPAREGVPRDGQRVSSVTGIDRHRDRYPHVVGTPAVLGGDLGRSDGRAGRIGQSTLEAAADGSPRHASRRGAARSAAPGSASSPSGRPPRHVLMITYRR